MISTSISTVSDLRFKTKQVLAKASQAPVFVFHRSTPKGVLLSMENYEALMSTLEDFYLSVRAEEYEKEDKMHIAWLSDEELRKKLRTP